MMVNNETEGLSNISYPGVRTAKVNEQVINARFEKIHRKNEKKNRVALHGTIPSILPLFKNEKGQEFVQENYISQDSETEKSEIYMKNDFKQFNANHQFDVAQENDKTTFKSAPKIWQAKKVKKMIEDEDDEPTMIFFDKNNGLKNALNAEMLSENRNIDETDSIRNQQPKLNRYTILQEVFDWVKHIAIAVVIGLLLVMFVVQRNVVIGSSMEPNLYENDQLIVEKVSKLYNGGITYRDIITVNAEGFLGHSGDKNIIKRVIGLPGDTIEIKDSAVYRNGQKVEEPYLNGMLTNEREPNYSNVKLLENEFYVLGDNRNVSLDSRTFGPINKSRIIGEVLVRFYPLNKFGKP